MNLMRCHLTYDQRVGISLKIRGPLAEEAANRKGGRPYFQSFFLDSPALGIATFLDWSHFITNLSLFIK